MFNDLILYVDEFVDILKKKVVVGIFKKMVIYVEVCESGSIFDGFLFMGLNIYVIIVLDLDENSWGIYCFIMIFLFFLEFGICFGDFYSVFWMEDV